MRKFIISALFREMVRCASGIVPGLEKLSYNPRVPKKLTLTEAVY